MAIYTGTAAADSLSGSSYDDTIDGAGGNDSLYGGKGNDRLIGSDGNDSLEGGYDWDTAVFRGSFAEYKIALAGSQGLTVTDLVGARDGADWLSGVEYLAFADGRRALAEALESHATIGNDDLFGPGLLDGLAGNDRLEGWGGSNDTLKGGPGDDRLDGGVADADTAVFSGARADYAVSYSALSKECVVRDLVSGRDGTDTLVGIEWFAFADGTRAFGGMAFEHSGAAGNDTLRGSGGNDSLAGHGGNDELDGAAGDDLLDGGAGTDAVVYLEAPGPVRVDLLDGTATGAFGNDTLRAIEIVYGSAFGDFLSGNEGANDLFGASGNDTLRGGAGDDYLFGSDGSDLLEGGEGADQLVAGAGTDTLAGGEGVDTALFPQGPVEVDLQDGWTRVRGTEGPSGAISGVENVRAGGLNDVVSGDAAANLLEGDWGSDHLRGRSGDDTLLGGPGIDVLAGGQGDDTIDGGSEQDFAQFVGTFAEYLISWTGGNYVVTDTLAGRDGTDKVSNVEMFWFLDGIRAADQLYLGGNVIVPGSAGADSQSGGPGHDTLQGGAGNDTQSGGAGNDRLDGHDGEDILSGGAGDDHIDGWNDLDLALYSGPHAQYGFTLDPAAQKWLVADSVANRDGRDEVRAVEFFQFADGLWRAADLAQGVPSGILGTAAHDAMNGGATADLLSGLAGDDTISGGSGNDTVVGGPGDDLLDGGPGLDYLWGGDGVGDVVSYASEAAGVEVDLVAGAAYLETGQDRLTGMEGVIGSDFADVLRGSQTANRLDGGAGNDTLLGGSGDDFIMPGAGDDVIDGGEGLDVLGYAASDIASYGRSGEGWALVEADGGTDVLTGVERITSSEGAYLWTVALELEGDIGTVVHLIGAALGPAAVQNPGYVGFAMRMLEMDHTVAQLAALASTFLPDSNAGFVTALYTNVMGFPPTPDEVAGFSGVLASGLYTRTSLLMAAAATPMASEAIGLPLLEQQGLRYYYEHW